ncbi:MAG: DUF4347 domain-containing protein [Gammaproteobacteria bacterium]
MEELEPRLLFSADSIVGLLNSQDAIYQSYDSGPAESQLFQSEDIYQPSVIQSVSYEIVFFDDSVNNYQQLFADLQVSQDANRRFEVYVLDSDRDGIEQISEILGDQQIVDAIHIVSHGDSGRVNLGNSWLDSNNLNRYSEAIADWSQVLGDKADLLIYGCDLASSDEGKALTNALSELTGADVAASVDLTGNALLGGDWDLEYKIGQVETAVAFSQATQQSWNEVLATITVTTFNDFSDGGDTSDIASLLATPGTDGISLREAIIATNNDAGQADTIILSAGTYTLSISGINENFAATGDLNIRDDLIITGADASATIIDGGGIDRVIEARSGVTLTMNDVTVTGGSTSSLGGGIDVQASAQLNLNRVSVTGNQAANGAGISNRGTINLTDVAISNNGDGTTVIGGGVWNQGAATLDRVTLNENRADSGAGIFNDSTATSLALTNVTVSGNTATVSGGGLYTNSAATIYSSTFTLNTADTGGGIHIQNPGTITLTNSIIEGNTGTTTNKDVQGFFNSLGYNLIGDTSGGSGFIGSDLTGGSARLGTLGNYGGFGKTHLLNGGSAAIDAGTLTGAPTIDQRGTARPLDSNGDLLVVIDIGAVEMTPDVLVHAADTNIQETSSELRGSHQAIAMDSSGNYVVVWSSQNQDGSGWGVFAQRFNADGTTNGSLIPVNVTTAGDQRWASIAMDATGQFAVVWTAGSDQDGNGEGVFMRRFDVNGNAIDNVDIQVNIGTISSNQRNPSIAMNASGQMVIVWQSTGSNDGIYARLFNMVDSTVVIQALTTEITVDTGPNSANPSVDINTAGKFVITWQKDSEPYAQRFDALGNKRGLQIDINTPTSSTETYPVVAVQESGDFVIAYRSDISIFKGVWVKHFQDNGSAYALATKVSSGFSHTAPSIAKDSAGNFIIVYEGNGDGTGVFGRKFDASRNSLGSEFVINQYITNNQHMASVAMQDTDNFTVVWSGEGPGDASGVFMRQYSSGITAPNVAPTTDDVSSNGAEDATSIAITLTGSDVDGTVDFFQISGLPLNGSLFTDAGLTSVAVIGTDYAASAEALIVYFVPDGHWNGTTSFQYAAKDSGGQLDATLATATITVTPVNDAPDGADTTVTGMESTNYVLNVSDFGFTDVIDGDNFQAVEIVSLPIPGAGSLQVNGANVVAGQIVNVADITAGKLVFSPLPGLNGLGVGSFTFRVQDDGGTATGGVNTDPIANTLTINVTAVNDMPTTSGATNVTVNEDAPNTVINLFATFADAEDADNALVYSIRTNTNPGLFASTVINPVAGTLTLDYAPDQNGSADITLRATDTGGLFVETVFTVTVNPVNDMPTTSGITNVIVNEDAPDTLIDVFSAFSDAEDPDLAMTYTLVNNTNPGLFSATTIDVITGTLRLGYMANQNGSADLTVRATDTAGQFVELTFNATVNPVNDAPTGTNLSNSSLQGDTDSAGGVEVGVLSASDVDQGDTASFSIVGGADAANFLVTGVNNNLLTINDGVLSESQQPSYEVIVRVTDSGGLTHDESLTIVVIDLDETLFLSGSENAQQAVQSNESVEVVVIEESITPPDNEKSESVESLNLETPETVLGGSNAVPPMEVINENQTQALQNHFVEKTNQPDLAITVATKLEKFTTSLLSKIEGPQLNTHFGAIQMAMKAFNASAGASEFIEKLDGLREGALDATLLEQKIVGSSMVLTSGLSVGYIIWLVRGGVLLSSVLSSLPAWRFIDPLPILGTLNGRDRKADEENETLESLIRDGRRKAREKRLVEARAKNHQAQVDEKEFV